MQAAIAAGNAVPRVRLELIDAVPHYQTLQSGGPSGRHAAVVASDGALVQVYHDGTGTLYARRVVDPSAPSWDPWQALPPSAAAGAGVALVRLSDRLRLLWQDSATTGVHAADSFDDGATWSAGALLFDPGAALCALAACDAAPVFVAAATESGTWRIAVSAVWTPSGTVWSGSDWTNGDAFAVTGLDVLRRDDGSYLVALSSQASAQSGTSLSVCSYSAGGWSPLAAIIPGDVGAGRSIAAPRLGQYDGRYHLTCALVDSGSVSEVPSARCALLHSSDGLHWSDPLEDAGSYAHGAVPLQHAAGYLLAAPDTCALAAPYSASPSQYRDLSFALSRLDVVQQEGEPARLVVTLQHGDGWAGDGLPLQPNALLRLSLGYDGTDLVPAYLGYVERWSVVLTVDTDELVITAADGLARLDRTCRGTLTYRGQTVEALAREIAARAGLLTIAVPATAQFARTIPAFTIAAGTTWRAALDRLARIYGFSAAMRAQPDGSDLLALMEKNPLDSPMWRYGDDPLRIAMGQDGERANHVLVFGAPGAGTPVGEAWDWPAVTATGQERLLHRVEPLIATGADAGASAALALQIERRAGAGATLRVPLHAGLELGDVIVAGASAPAAVRIIALHHSYDPVRTVYDTALLCEGV